MIKNSMIYTPEIISFHCQDIDNLENWRAKDPFRIDLWIIVDVMIYNSDKILRCEAHILSSKLLKQVKKQEYLFISDCFNCFSDFKDVLSAAAINCSSEDLKTTLKNLSKAFKITNER